MPVFKCPVCRRIHVVARGTVDFVCTNSQIQEKKFQDMVDEEILTKNNWNLDEWNTKKDVYRDVHLSDIKTMPSDKNKYAGGVESHNW